MPVVGEDSALELGGEIGVGSPIGGKANIPVGFGAGTSNAGIPRAGDIGRAK